MRRILAAAVLGAALFTAAACADKPVDKADPTASAQAAGMTKEEACAKLKKASDEFTAQMGTVLGEVMKDPSTAEAKMPEVVAAFTTFQAAYGADVASIPDAELKAAVEADLTLIAGMISAVAASGGDLDKLMASLSTPEFEKAGEEVEKLCGVTPSS